MKSLLVFMIFSIFAISLDAQFSEDKKSEKQEKVKKEKKVKEDKVKKVKVPKEPKASKVKVTKEKKETEAKPKAELKMRDDGTMVIDGAQPTYRKKPKSVTELGLNVGHSYLAGDIESALFSGFGAGAHLRRSLGYNFSLRLEYQYGKTSGIDAAGYSISGLDSDIPMISSKYDSEANFIRNYEVTSSEISLQGILNFGNVLFHQAEPKWNIYIYGGIGLLSYETNVDAFMSDDAAYDFTPALSEDSEGDIRDKAKEILDGEYETESWKDEGELSDDLFLDFMAGFGLSRRLSQRVNISLDHKISFTGSDRVDGYSYSGFNNLSSDKDVFHFTSIRIGINIGNLSRAKEPLYWVNPMDPFINDVAELKARPEFDLTDTDKDGVIDMLDQENNTPMGAAVDTKGRALDSDGDGINDFEDIEPYSPPGYTYNEKGVALIEDESLNEDDVNKMIDERIAKLEDRINSQAPSADDAWFLPMVHFDLNKFYLKPEYYPSMHHVATVMHKHPSMRIVVTGHTDQSSNQSHNDLLSWKRANAVVQYISNTYALSRDRFVLQYSGEGAPLIQDVQQASLKGSKDAMNRRVEFRVADGTERDMSRPN